MIIISYLKLLAKFRNGIRNCPLLYKILLSFLNFKNDVSISRLVNSESMLCIEGYPRSANSFLYYLLKKLYPEVNINIVYKKDYNSLIERFGGLKGEENHE